MVQVHIVQCSSQYKFPIQSVHKSVSVVATLLFIWYQPIRVWACLDPPLLLNAMNALGIPIDLQTSLILFDLCLVINCRLKENIKSFKW